MGEPAKFRLLILMQKINPIVLFSFSCCVLSLQSCAMPMSIRHVADASAEPNGIRYFLSRPSYELTLNVSNQTQLNEISENDGCINVSHSVSFKLKQEMKGTPEIYEINGPNFLTGIANAFADTSATATFGENATLLTFESSAEDKSLEFIAAVAELAIGTAKYSAQQGRQGRFREDSLQSACLMNEEKARVKKFVDRRLSVMNRLRQLKRAIDASHTKLNTATPKEQKLLLEGIGVMRNDIKLAQKELKETVLSVKPSYYCLIIGGKTLNPKTGKPKAARDEVCLQEKKLLTLTLS